MSSRVLVVGDSIADVYREFEYRKQCPDAPATPAGVLSRVEVRPGGAANVAVNLAALAPSDCSIQLISVLDVETARAVKAASSNRVEMSKCALVDQEQSLRKERILFDGWDKGNRDFIVRLDNRSSIDPLDAEGVCQSVRNYLDPYRPLPDLVVLSDYAGGVLTDRLLEELAPVRDRLLVDTKRTDLSCFSGSLLAKLNAAEHRRVLLEDHSPERYFRYFVVTRGEMGVRLIMRNDFDEHRLGFPHHVFGSAAVTMEFPAREVDAVDVCGCGDTFLAGLAAGLIRYGSAFEAVSFANAAAATVVTQPRTSVADLRMTLGMTGREA